MASYHRKILFNGRKGPDRPPEDDAKYKLPCLDCHDCRIPCDPPQNHQFSRVLVLSLCILGAALLFLAYFAIRRFRSSRRRRYPPPENHVFREDVIDELHGPMIDHPIWYIRTVGLPQSVIDSIQVFKYKAGQGLIEGSDCSVCLSEFGQDESLRLLPKCSHAFHVACIDTWLRSHKNCPVCRAPVVAAVGNEPNSGDTSSSNSESTEENRVESGAGREETGEVRSGDEILSGLPVEDEKLAQVSSAGNGRNDGFRVLSDLAEHGTRVDRELEPVRRSVSLDFSSASIVYVAVANLHAKKDRNSTVLFQGPISAKRSFSFDGKHSPKQRGRTQESIPI